MPYFESPALYIDFSRLPPPDIIETIKYETLLDIYKNEVLAKNPLLESALRLDQSPTNLILQAEAYGEMLVRARINAAVRAVMLAFAIGNDLDNLGALFNVFREQTVASDGKITKETDERYRRRIQLGPEAFSTAGSAGSYIFQGLTADPTIRDIAAIKADDNGTVKIVVMNSGSDPTPTTEQLEKVRERLNRPNIKPLTTVIKVIPVKVTRANIDAKVTLYPGPDQNLILKDINKNLNAVRSRLSSIGRDLNRAAITAAMTPEGVQDVDLYSPLKDIESDGESCVVVDSAKIEFDSYRRD